MRGRGLYHLVRGGEPGAPVERLLRRDQDHLVGHAGRHEMGEAELLTRPLRYLGDSLSRFRRPL